MDWIVAHPAAAKALATMALVAVGLLIGGGQIAVVWHSISAMRRSDERLEDERERLHRKAMDRMADDRLASRDRHREMVESLTGQREAFKALVERKVPGTAPTE